MEGIGELWRPEWSSGGSRDQTFEDVWGHLLDPGGSEAESSIHSSNPKGGAETQELRLQGCGVVSRWFGAAPPLRVIST